MQSRTNKLGMVLRASVLLSICLIIYVGPASIGWLDDIFDNDVFDGTSGSSKLAWTGIVWLFAIPLITAQSNWNTNPAKSAMGLGIFMLSTLITWMLIPGFGVTILSTALAAPFQSLSADPPTEDTYYNISMVLSFVVCVVIPTIAIVFQVTRREGWDRLLE